MEWTNSFPNAEVIHESFCGSDHCPIILRPDNMVGRRRILFRFETNWQYQSRVSKIIAKAWNEDIGRSAMFQVVSKLKICKKELLNKRTKSNRELNQNIKNSEWAIDWCSKVKSWWVFVGSWDRDFERIRDSPKKRKVVLVSKVKDEMVTSYRYKY